MLRGLQQTKRFVCLAKKSQEFVLSRAYSSKKGVKKHRPAKPVPEMTPGSFTHMEGNHDYVLSFSAKSLGAVNHPPVPETDCRALTNADWTRSKSKLAITSLKEVELYPDVFVDLEDLKTNLKINLCVKYGEGYYESVLLGNYLPCESTLSAPQVSFPTDGVSEDSLYTLIMFTTDHPGRIEADNTPFVHWLVTNIPGNDISKGQTVVDYLSPIPTEAAGTYRYMFALYKQEGNEKFETLAEKLKASETNNEIERRRNFDLEDFINNYKLEEVPSGLCHFRTDYDFSVSHTYKKLNIEEHMYIPPDIIENLKNRKTSTTKFGYNSRMRQDPHNASLGVLGEYIPNKLFNIWTH